MRYCSILPLLACFLVCTQFPTGSCCVQTVKNAFTSVKNTFKNVAAKIRGAKPKYVGCYADRDDDRDVQFIGARKEDMTQRVCNRICMVKYPMTRFFAMQDGNLCFCGNDYGKHGVKMDGACNKPCAGDAKQMCGGKLLNSVYEILK